MKGFFKKLRDIWHHEELRKKILLTLGLILIYRIGSFIILPGVNSEALESSVADGGGGLMDLLALFTGGAFTRASIFALGIMPYISASIIMQLLGIAVPTITKMQKEGESGRKKINQYTRFLTIAITLVQSPGYLASTVVGVPGAVPDPSAFWWFSAVTILVCSTLLIMWLGEKITDKGIGNGISLIIMIGIIASLPQAIAQEFIHPDNSLYFFLIEIAALLVIIGASVLLTLGVRRVPVHSARRTAGQTHLPQGEQARSYIPLRVNSAGVMPIIFAQALMFLPAVAAQIIAGQQSDLNAHPILRALNDFTSAPYNIIYFIMVVAFTYVYTALMVNPTQYAEYLKRQNAFIPGVKPGKATADFIDSVTTRITLPGAVILGFIAILPSIARAFGVNTGFAQFFGGTSLLIMVGVVLDTLQQIESHLLMRRYDGLVKSGRIQGRNSGRMQSIGANM